MHSQDVNTDARRRIYPNEIHRFDVYVYSELYIQEIQLYTTEKSVKS